MAVEHSYCSCESVESQAKTVTLRLHGDEEGMRCPLCDGEFEPIELRTISGRLADTKHCLQCGGFWFPRALTERLEPQSVAVYDVEQPNYSLKSDDLMCPIDRTLLERTDDTGLPTGTKLWHCPDCEGAFYPRGQLALITRFQAENDGTHYADGLRARSRAALGVSLSIVLIVLMSATIQHTSPTFEAAGAAPLPTSGPNVLTLMLLALAYLAGTVLAVLGRRLAMIVLGWGVISICLFGFAVVIFGP